MATRIQYEYTVTAVRGGTVLTDVVKSYKAVLCLLAYHLKNDREVTIERIEL